MVIIIMLADIQFPNLAINFAWLMCTVFVIDLTKGAT